jgi:hypothetical protein
VAETIENLRYELDNVICRMWEIGLSDDQVRAEVRNVFDEHPVEDD